MNNNLNFEPSYKELREKIQEHFSMGELKGLCFDIGLDFEDLSGDEKIEKTVQLIKYMQRREQLPELIQALYEKRQNVNWESCLGGGEDDIHYVKLISMRRTSDARKIHDTKHIASKIDMGGVQLTSFLKEIITDPKQEMIKRLFNEDVRVYAVFVHPDANCLIQRSIEDSDDLENLRESQRVSVEMCLKLFNKLDAYYQQTKNSLERPLGRLKIKLTKFCPYLSIERYDTDIYWGLYTSDSPGLYAPMFLATEEDNKFLFEKLKNHFRKWFSGDFKGEEEDLVLINMIAKAPRLNLELANNILGEDRVLGVLGNNHNKIPNSI